jgi:hypothetical protein
VQRAAHGVFRDFAQRAERCRASKARMQTRASTLFAFVVSIVFVVSAAVPARSRAQERDAPLPEVTVTVRYSPTVEAAAPTGQLRLVEPPMRARLGPNSVHPVSTREADAGGLLALGGVVLGLSLLGLGAVLAEAPTFGESWPEWAIAVTALAAPYSAAGLLTVGIGAGLTAGDDGVAAMVAVGAIEVVLGIVLASAALAIAPGVGEPWSDRSTQARTAEILAIEALSLTAIGLVPVLVAITTEEEDDEPAVELTAAPILGPTTIGVQLGGNF